MLPVMRMTAPRMGQGLPDKRSAANRVRLLGLLSGQAEPDRPLTLTTAWNRPALGASSKEVDSGSGARSNRAGWPGWVREGGTLFLIRRNKRRTGDAVGGGLFPRGDRTQISEAPQEMESLHKCALDPLGSTGNRLTLPRQSDIQPKDVLNFQRV